MQCSLRGVAQEQEEREEQEQEQEGPRAKQVGVLAVGNGRTVWAVHQTVLSPADTAWGDLGVLLLDLVSHASCGVESNLAALTGVVGADVQDRFTARDLALCNDPKRCHANGVRAAPLR